MNLKPKVTYTSNNNISKGQTKNFTYKRNHCKNSYNHNYGYYRYVYTCIIFVPHKKHTMPDFHKENCTHPEELTLL